MIRTTPAGSLEGVTSGQFVRMTQTMRSQVLIATCMAEGARLRGLAKYFKKQSDRVLLNNLARVADFEWAAEIRGSKGKGQQLKRKRGLPRMSRRSFTFSTVASLDERGRQRYSFAIARSGSRI